MRKIAISKYLLVTLHYHLSINKFIGYDCCFEKTIAVIASIAVDSYNTKNQRW